MSSFASRARRVLIAVAVVALNACSSSSGLTEPLPGPGRPQGEPADCPDPHSCPVNLSTGTVIASTSWTIAHATAQIARSA